MVLGDRQIPFEAVFQQPLLRLLFGKLCTTTTSRQVQEVSVVPSIQRNEADSDSNISAFWMSAATSDSVAKVIGPLHHGHVFKLNLFASHSLISSSTSSLNLLSCFLLSLLPPPSPLLLPPLSLFLLCSSFFGSHSQLPQLTCITEVSSSIK